MLRRRLLSLFAIASLVLSLSAAADELPIVVGVEAQPLKAQVQRVVQALQILGEPLTQEQQAALDQALAILKEHDVAVIVTDQRMPRMTGLEFLKAARTLKPDAVGIILTAYTDVDVLIE